MLVFLITALGFTPFSFLVTAPQFRCQVTGLLILTSVNFRWILTQRLPSVSYLTSLDKYTISCLFFLVFFCIWHSLISSSVLTTVDETRKSIDMYFLIASALLFALLNVVVIGWFVKMLMTIRTFKRSTEMNSYHKKLDLENAPAVLKQQDSQGRSLSPLSNNKVSNGDCDKKEEAMKF